MIFMNVGCGFFLWFYHTPLIIFAFMFILLESWTVLSSVILMFLKSDFFSAESKTIFIDIYWNKRNVQSTNLPILCIFSMLSSLLQKILDITEKS